MLRGHPTTQTTEPVFRKYKLQPENKRRLTNGRT